MTHPLFKHISSTRMFKRGEPNVGQQKKEEVSLAASLATWRLNQDIRCPPFFFLSTGNKEALLYWKVHTTSFCKQRSTSLWCGRPRGQDRATLPPRTGSTDLQNRSESADRGVTWVNSRRGWLVFDWVFFFLIGFNKTDRREKKIKSCQQAKLTVFQRCRRGTEATNYR